MPPEPVEAITEGGPSDDGNPDDQTDLDILTPGDDDKDVAPVDTPDDDTPDDDTPADDDTPSDDDDEPADDDDKDDDDKKKDDDEPDDDDKTDDDDQPEDLDEDERAIEDVVKRETPEYKDIQKKYPKFFKDFPGMRHTLFRMKRMDRIFTTVEEAEQTVEKHDDLLQLEDAVVKGEPDKVLRGLKAIRPEGLDQFADNFLPALYKDHREVHDRITTNLLSTALRVAQQQARSSGNKNLFHSVGHLSQFLFNSDTPPEVRKTAPSPELQAERDRFNQEKTQFFEAQAREFQGDVVQTGERLLRKEISRNLDPDDVLPDFIKKSIVDTALAEIGDALDKDDAHVQAMNALWQRSTKAGYSKDAKAKLVAAYLGRAKRLAGPIKRRLVKAAVAKQSGDSRGGRNINRRPHIRQGGKGKSGKGFRPRTAREVDWNRTSDLDILEGKATPRRR